MITYCVVVSWHWLGMNFSGWPLRRVSEGALFQCVISMPLTFYLSNHRLHFCSAVQAVWCTSTCSPIENHHMLVSQNGRIAMAQWHCNYMPLLSHSFTVSPNVSASENTTFNSTVFSHWFYWGTAATLVGSAVREWDNTAYSSTLATVQLFSELCIRIW